MSNIKLHLCYGTGGGGGGGGGGGRVSDKMPTQKIFFFLSFLEPGDAILADQGFTIHEDLLQYSLVGKINYLKEKLKRPDEQPIQLACISMSRECLA